MSSTNATVQVAVTINAEPETVWRFMSEPEKFLAWMTYLPGAPTPPGSTFEPRPGGALRIIFPNGGAAKGSVVELEPCKRLVFTWGYDPDVAKTGLAPGACRIELSLARVPRGTLVTLTHSGPMSEPLAKGHEAGWRHYLSQLAVQSTREAVESHIAGTLEMYFSAWNERDEAERSRLLGACCEPSVRTLTAFACCDSLDELSSHIGNGLRHMPGCSTRPAGEPKHVHGYLRAPWVVAAPDGKAIFSGESFLKLSPTGRIRSIVSFPS